MSKVPVGPRSRMRPVALPLVDPVVEWAERPRRSDAVHDGLRLVVLRVGGGWAYELYRGAERRPVQAGAVAGWSRVHAKDAAVRQALLISAQAEAAALRANRARGTGRGSSPTGPVAQRLPLQRDGAESP